MAIREGIPTILGPATMPHNQWFAISEGTKGWEEGWENCSGWQTNFVFTRIPRCSFPENLKHEAWWTSEVSSLPLHPPDCPFSALQVSDLSERVRVTVLPKQANLNLSLPRVLHSVLLGNCKFLEKQHFQLQEAVPLLAVVFHKWGWRSFKASGLFTY